MIRTRQHKLILRYPYKGKNFPNELYDLQADPRETKNVYGDESLRSVVTELTGRIDSYFKKFEVESRSGLRMETQLPFNKGSTWALAASYPIDKIKPRVMP